MIRPPPRSTRTDTLFPYTTLFRSGVVIDMIDVGGGFPSIYPGLEPPAMEDYFAIIARHFEALPIAYNAERSEEHTSELQSLMRISYAVFCLKKKKKKYKRTRYTI